jgi:transcriptional regulator with XRE-family HTH domain
MQDSPMPRRRRTGRTYGKQKRDLILFGQWIEVLNEMCQTNQAEIAPRIGISKSVLSKITRGQSGMKRDTVLKLLHIYEEMVAEQQLVLLEKWQYCFFLAWSNDETLMKESRAMLEYFLERRKNV